MESERPERVSRVPGKRKLPLAREPNTLYVSSVLAAWVLKICVCSLGRAGSSSGLSCCLEFVSLFLQIQTVFQAMLDLAFEGPGWGQVQ